MTPDPPVVSEAAGYDAEAGVGEDPAGPDHQQDVRHRGVVLAVELHVPHPGREDHDRGGGGSRGGLAVTEPRSCLRKDVRKLCKWIWWSSDAGLQSYTRTSARTCWTESEGAEKEIVK